MTLIFVNRYFYPDESATSQILSDVVFDLAEQGHDVTVLTSRMAYDDASRQFPKSETINGVTVIRAKTTRLGRNNLWRRAIDYFSFYIAVFFSVLRRAKRGDFVIAKTDPPLLSIPIWIAARLKGAGFGNWLQDLYPEVARELGISFVQGRLGHMLQALRNLSLKRADRNIVIGQRMQELLVKEGVQADTISQIPNWTDDKTIYPLANHDNALRAEWGIGPDDFVIGYSGNLGRAHDLGTMMGAAKALRSQATIKFLFIGGGKLREDLQRLIDQDQLTNVILKPYQPRENLAQSLSVADVHWASLIPGLEGTIVPSKIYGIAAAGRPLLFVGDVDGEAGRLISQFNTGQAVAVGDHDGLINAITTLQQSRDLRDRQGKNARDMIDSHYNKAVALSSWRDLATALSKDGSAA